MEIVLVGIHSAPFAKGAKLAVNEAEGVISSLVPRISLVGDSR